ncbi:MAG: CDP-alcohol phosphatidyltransferase family protein [Aeromicrobium sp.]
MTTAETPSNLNVPNALTLLRILGVPVFGWLLLTQGGDSIEYRVWAFVAFALLMITDKIDGDLARKHNLITNLGKIADPIADKALTGMAFVGLSIIGLLWWPVTILVLVREWGITLMRFIVIKYGVMPAGRGGKLKTMLQSIALGGYILPFDLWDNWAAEVMRWGFHAVMFAAVVVTLVTGVDYVRQAIVMRREQKQLNNS